jgi:hypothetical protein
VLALLLLCRLLARWCHLLSCLMCWHHAPAHLMTPQLDHVIAVILQAAGKVVAIC